MKRLLQMLYHFVAQNLVGDDPTMELSRLDQEGAAAHARYLIEGLM
ncbi:hypothetical protein AB0N71_04725 [Pseudarthrobacter enclensis]